MPRPRKCRKVCQMPRTQEFRPVGAGENQGQVVMTVDEYEAIRLIDRQGFSQEACSSYMGVARTTVQLIYNSARKKLADALVEGLPLRIEGGEYRLCDGKEAVCGCGGCSVHRCAGSKHHLGGNTMKIAVPLDENRRDVCIVLARAPYFLFREQGQDTVVENPAAQAQGGAGIQAAQFLVDSGVDVLITVRCGQNAAEVFQAADMEIYHSVHQAAAEDLAAYEAGELEKLTHFHGGFQGIQ